jgi:streptogramin lyase
MTRRARSRGAVIAALAAGVSGWGCGGNTASSSTPNECGGDAACEANVTPGCLDDAACVSSSGSADGGSFDGAHSDGAGLTMIDSGGLPSTECDGGACVACEKAPAGTSCGGESVCNGDGSCIPGCDGGLCSPIDSGMTGMTCPTAGMSCPLPGVCYYGVIECIDGQPLCETGMPLPNGSSCESAGSVCINGNCSTQFYVTAVPTIASSTLSISGVLFNVTDVLTSDSASALTVVLDWGDGTTSNGTVAGSAGSFTVSGSHAYAALGAYTVTLTLNGSPFSATVRVSVGFTIFPVPDAGSSIISGPDGNLWFTMPDTNQIGRMTPAGVVTAFDIPTPNAGTTMIAPGPDGNLWFIESATNKIASITPLGAISEYDIPTLGSQPSGIAAGPDGNLWFTESLGDKIGRISPTGTNATEFSIPIAGAAPVAIIAGPDGNLWFTLLNIGANASAIGTITPAGVINVITIPIGDGPSDIVIGPDGNVWYANVGAQSLGRVTPSGVVTEVEVGMYSTALAVGPDSNFWFVGANYGGDTTNFEKVTPAGVTTAYTLPSEPMGVTTGPDGNLWVTEEDDAIVMIVVP